MSMQPRKTHKVIVMLMTLVGCTCVGSTALAAPKSDQASCEAILTLTDAPNQYRDDVAREFASLGFPPGEIYSLAARATGTTEEECLASIGF